ncbi:MAG: Cys-Cys-COOH (seleno)protein SaoC [Lachnospiraceae bacterium]
MKQIRNFFKKPVGKILLLAIVLIVAFQIKLFLDERGSEKAALEMRNANYAPNVSQTNKMLQDFREKHKKAEVVLACEEDITDDGLKDLVVIYQEKKQVRMVTIVDPGQENTYLYSKPVPGPKENQKIQFRNIDQEGVIEFIVSGEKKGAAGYAIYRIIEGEPVDLFGEGMEDCC